MADAITIRLEDSEERILLDGQHILADGRNWNLNASMGVGVDNVTYTGMLLPLPYTGLWQSAGTGDYARLRMAAYNVAGSTSAWYELQPGFAGNYYLCSRGTVMTGEAAVTVQTTEDYERNRGIYLSWFSPGAGVDQGTAIEFGWVAPLADVSVRVLNNGDVEVFDGTAFLLTNNLRSATEYPGTVGPQGATTGAAAAQGDNKYQDILAIPCRGREVLFLSRTWGGGFNVTIPRIAPDAVDPTITAAGPLWWQVPSGQAIVQMAPMHYERVGTVYSSPHWLRYAPGTANLGSVTVYSGTAGYGAATIEGTVVTPAGAAIGTADQAVCIRLGVTGDGISSPWVYAAKADWAATMGTVPSEATVGSVLSRVPCRLTVDETPGEVRLEFGLAYPAALEGSALPLARTLSNRPVQIALGGTVIWKGRTETPRWQEAVSDEARTLTIPCRDYWSVLENYRIFDPTPLDGLNMGSAVASFLTMAGFGTAQMDIGASDYAFERTQGESQGEWNLIPTVGDTPAQWLQRIQEDYAKTWYMGWVPGTDGPVFRFKSPDQLGTVPVGTVTLTSGTAGVGNVARSWDAQTLAPEANDIWVIGADPRTQAPIVYHYADADSMDPTLAGTARPANWLGEPRRYSWVNPAINGTASAQWCTGILRDRLTHERELVEFESEMLIRPDGLPVWRGDVLSIGASTGSASYRVRTLATEFPLEVGGTVTGFGIGGVWRPTRYMVEKLR